MSDQATTRQKICSVDAVAEGGQVVERVDDVEIAVIREDGNFYAIENVCPHQGGPVGEGKVEDGCVYCPWHGWQFELESGKHVQGEATIQQYPVHVEDNDLFVEL